MIESLGESVVNQNPREPVFGSATLNNAPRIPSPMNDMAKSVSKDFGNCVTLVQLLGGQCDRFRVG